MNPRRKRRIERGPAVISSLGDPNGLYWNDKTQTLYLADDDGNRILKWLDAQQEMLYFFSCDC
jgi:hypothetical protein